jgi:diguanylate cyclase (GGDEF)-like protein
MLDNFDQLAEDNYAAGADDVVSSRISAAILRSKIISVFNLKLTTDDLRTAIHKLQQITLLDELTGLANMRGFLKGLSNSMEHNKRTGIAVAMMDLDRFKRINDTTNHMVGSHIIKSVGRILYGNSCFGPLDFAARYGGDEFIIILHGDTMLEQKMKMESLRKIIEKTMFQFQDFNLRVTASIGLSWASRNFNGKPEDLVKLADAMLYRSKDLGRNRVSAATFDEGYKNQSLKVTQLQPADDKYLVKTVNKQAG